MEFQKVWANSYRLHPLAAKYASHDDMEKAFRAALADIEAGKKTARRYLNAPHLTCND